MLSLYNRAKAWPTLQCQGYYSPFVYEGKVTEKFTDMPSGHWWCKLLSASWCCPNLSHYLSSSLFLASLFLGLFYPLPSFCPCFGGYTCGFPWMAPKSYLHLHFFYSTRLCWTLPDGGLINLQLNMLKTSLIVRWCQIISSSWPP